MDSVDGSDGGGEATGMGSTTVGRALGHRDGEVGVAELHLLGELRRALFGQTTHRTFDRYEVRRELGMGGLGLVYEAYDPDLDRKVAIKIVRAQASERQQARLIREAHALAKLNHPNVVAIYDVGSFDLQAELEGTDHHRSGIYLVMELVDGPSLDRWLEETTRSRSEILRVGIAAGRGIEAAHSVGVLHRDIKPGNIVIGSDGRARVLDFGLARHRTDSTDPRYGSPAPRSSQPDLETEDGTIMGTPAFMPPEQRDGAEVDERTDQFAFCVTLFRALYDRHPFGAPGLRDAAMRSHAIDHPPPGQRAPARIHAALVRGLHPDPQQRWPDMTALLSQLRPPSPSLARPAALLAVTALCALPWLVPDPQIVPPCPAELSVPELSEIQLSDALVEALGPDQRTRLRQAFVDVADELRRVHDAACVSMTADEPASVLQARRECLERRVGDLNGVLRRAAQAGPDEVFDIPSQVGDVAALASCTGGETPNPSAPPELLPALQAVQKENAEAYEQLLAGQGAEARQRLTASLRRAEELGYAPVTAETMISLASAVQLTDPLAANALYEDAYWVAIQGSVIEMAAYAAAAAAVAWSERDITKARVWIRHGRALLKRSAMNPHVEGSLRLAEARVAGFEEDWAAAEHAYDDVIANYGAAGGLRNATVVSASLNRTNAIAEQGRLDEAREGYDTLIAELDATYGPEHRYPATVRLSLAQHFVQRSDRAAARAILDRVEGTQTDPNHRVAVQQTRSQIAFDEGRYDDAEAHRRAAIAILGETGRGETSEAAGHRMAMIEIRVRAGDLDGAEALVAAVQAEVEAMGRGESFALAQAQAEVAFARGDHDAALSHYDRALVSLHKDAPSRARIAMARTARAEVLLALGRAAEAVEELRAAKQVNDVAPKRISTAARTNDALARALQQSGEATEAEVDSLVSRALELYEQAGPGWQREAEALRAWQRRAPG